MEGIVEGKAVVGVEGIVKGMVARVEGRRGGERVGACVAFTTTYSSFLYISTMSRFQVKVSTILNAHQIPQRTATSLDGGASTQSTGVRRRCIYSINGGASAEGWSACMHHRFGVIKYDGVGAHVRPPSYPSLPRVRGKLCAVHLSSERQSERAHLFQLSHKSDIAYNHSVFGNVDCIKL